MGYQRVVVNQFHKESCQSKPRSLPSSRQIHSTRPTVRSGYTQQKSSDLSTLVVSSLRFNRPAAVPHAAGAAPTAVAAAAAAAAQVEKPLHCQKFLTRTTTKLFSGGHNINKHALVVANGCGRERGRGR